MPGTPVVAIVSWTSLSKAVRAACTFSGVAAWGPAAGAVVGGVDVVVAGAVVGVVGPVDAGAEPVGLLLDAGVPLALVQAAATRTSAATETTRTSFMSCSPSGDRAI